MALERWVVDVARSTVGFTVRHLVVTKVHGRFTSFRGAFSFDEAEGLSRSSGGVEAEVDVASIDTGDAMRDEYMRTSDALDPSRFPTMKWKSGRVSGGKRRFQVAGDLTLRGVTRPLVLDVEYRGRTADVLSFSARGSLRRKDFGVAFNPVVDAGGVAVGEQVEVELEVKGTPAP